MKNPTPSPKGEYGSVSMTPMLGLFSKEGRDTFGIQYQELFPEPPTFESLGLNNYLVLYEAELPEVKTGVVDVEAVPKDRALVYIDDEYVNSLNRMNRDYNFSISRTAPAKKIALLVENMGRVNFGDVDVEDFKVKIRQFFLKVNRLRVENFIILGSLGRVLRWTKSITLEGNRIQIRFHKRS